MNTVLNRRPKLAIALQITLLMGIFQGVIATSPSTPIVATESGQLANNPITQAFGSLIPLRQPIR